MKISTRGRYALRLLVDMAEQGGDYVPLKEIAARQEISLKYAESIMTTLSKSGLVLAERGKMGGYRLAKESDQYTLGEILTLTEGSLHPVACLDDDAPACPRREGCRTVGVWQRLDRLVDDFFASIKLSDLLSK